MHERRAVLFPLFPMLAVSACTPAPSPPSSSATAPISVAQAVVAAATTAAASATTAPVGGPPCHFAQGVTPANPARICDPCSVEAAGGPRRPSAIHLEASGFMLGVQTLDVDPQGAATWSKRGPDPGAAPKTWRAKLSAEQLATLERALAAHHLCDHRSARFGIPDESTLLVSACLPTVRCEIMLWQGEWDGSPEAKQALAAIDAVIDDVVKRGAAPSP